MVCLVGPILCSWIWRPHLRQGDTSVVAGPNRPVSCPWWPRRTCHEGDHKRQWGEFWPKRFPKGSWETLSHWEKKLQSKVMEGSGRWTCIHSWPCGSREGEEGSGCMQLITNWFWESMEEIWLFLMTRCERSSGQGLTLPLQSPPWALRLWKQSAALFYSPNIEQKCSILS